jgi:hypothetical protein
LAQIPFIDGVDKLTNEVEEKIKSIAAAQPQGQEEIFDKTRKSY